ncbi:MAG TPA: hypothetical protein VGG14_14280 [Candidatus Sulfotelmatobacter sp.]|jgi:hypothetical protein
MELLLNLAWLLLVLPGYWLWRRSTYSRHTNSRQCLLALGCAFVLLFPVISATDDLHAMRGEMEDPLSCKRVVRPTGEKHTTGVNRLQGAAGLVLGALALPALEGRELQVPSSISSNAILVPVRHAGRAPPLSSLG